MNSSDPTPSRLSCRLVRAWSAVTGDPQQGAPGRHVAHCAACRAYFAAATALEDRLRRAAPRQARPLPEGFERRLERALAETVRAPDAPRAAAEKRTSVLWWSGFAGAAAAAAVAVVFFLQRPDSNLQQESQGPVLAETAPAPTDILNESVRVARDLNVRFWNDVAPTANTLVRENPLQQEIGAVYSEAQSALQFLAMNFLPVTAAVPATSPALPGENQQG